MVEGVLKSLLPDELQAVAHTIAGAPALRQFFAARPEVQDVGFALAYGVIDEGKVRNFVQHLLAELVPGVLFRHDRTLAALAVALEGRYSQFTDEYLRGLAGLNAAEMPFGPRVAREVLAHRSTALLQTSWVHFPEGFANPVVVTRSITGGQQLVQSTHLVKSIHSVKVG